MNTPFPPTESSIRRGWLLVVAAVGLVLFLLVTAVVVATGGTDPFDSWVHRMAISVRSPALTTVAAAVTRLGSFSFVVAGTLLAAGLLRRLTHSWGSSALLAISVGVTAAAVYLVKIAVGRPRPAIDSLLGTPSLDAAYPSGHTSDGGVAIVLGAALAAAALRNAPARRVIMISAMILAAAVGATRIYLGYHWASDVIGGWLLASVVVCLAAFLAPALSRPVGKDRGIDTQEASDHRAGNANGSAHRRHLSTRPVRALPWSPRSTGSG